MKLTNIYNQRLKETREDQDKTQAEVAKELKTTQAQIWKYEKGEQEIPAYRLKQLCELYNISADYILELPEGLPWGRKKRR